MQALEDILCERDRVKGWQTYMAEIAWVAARPQYKDFPFPSYLDIANPKCAVQDTRNAEQIRDDLVQKLRKDVKK